MAATRPSSRRPEEPSARAVQAAPAHKSIGTIVSELWSMSVAYAKQEIKDPLDGLLATVAWGIATMVLLGFGSVLLALGGLRALQTETGSTFDENLSWAPYLIVLAGAVIVLGLVGAVVTRGKRK